MYLKKALLGFFSGMSSSAFVAVVYFLTSNYLIKEIKSDVKSVSKVLDSIEDLNDKQEKIRNKDYGNRATTTIRGANRRKANSKVYRNGTKVRKAKKRAVRKDHKASK